MHSIEPRTTGKTKDGATVHLGDFVYTWSLDQCGKPDHESIVCRQVLQFNPIYGAPGIFRNKEVDARFFDGLPPENVFYDYDCFSSLAAFKAHEIEKAKKMLEWLGIDICKAQHVLDRLESISENP